MPDRWVFLAAFLTLVLVVASAFTIPEFFVYQLLTSTIFVVIAVLVFFGEDKFPYMLGMIAPILWFIFSLLTGGFFHDLGVMFTFFAGKPSAQYDTPLHGFAILTGLVLIIVSARAWRKQVTEKFTGKTFALALVVSLVWIGMLAVLQFRMISSGGMPH
jgi:hypothetical protein